MKKAVLIAVLLLLIIVGSGVVVAKTTAERYAEIPNDNARAGDTRIGTQLKSILQAEDVIESDKSNGGTGARFKIIEKSGDLYFEKIYKGTGPKEYVTNNDMRALLLKNMYDQKKWSKISSESLLDQVPTVAGPATAGAGATTPFAGADGLADKFSFDKKTKTVLPRTGLTSYRDGRRVLTIKPDGTSDETWYDQNKVLFRVNYDTNGENPSLFSIEGLNSLTGALNDPGNQEITSKLGLLGAFTTGQEAKAQSMPGLYNIIKANERVQKGISDKSITSLDQVPDNIKRYFDAADFDELKRLALRFETTGTSPPSSSQKTGTPPQPKTEAQKATDAVNEMKIKIAGDKLDAGEASTKTEELALYLETFAANQREQLQKKQEQLKKSYSDEQRKALQDEISALKKEISDLDSTAKELHQQALQFQWQSHWFFNMEKFEKEIREFGYGPTMVTIQSLLARGSRWSALSNAWLGETEWYQKWFDVSNNEYLQLWSNRPAFAITHTLTGSGWDVCKRDDALRAEIPGQSAQFVETPSGTYQFVGSIMAERSSEKVAVLCERNPDEEAEEEFVCGKKQVCVKDFCYADEDKDGEADPDAEEPLKGYFYKVSWGVSAPADESFTPFVDEDKKAVRFNLQLVGEKSVWLYKRSDASGTAVLALENGANDRAVITHFSTEEPPFNKACLRYDPSYPIKDRYGEQVTDQCVEIIKSDRGTVEFTKSDRSESVTSSSTEVEGNNEW